jgi:hypothetical protein
MDKLLDKSILLVANPRTGSNYVSRILSHYLDREVLKSPFEPGDIIHAKDMSYDKLDDIVDGMLLEERYLVKVHPQQTSYREVIQYNDIFKKFYMHDFYTIGLIRRDIFATALSWSISLDTGIWLPPYDYDRMEIDVESFVRQFKITLEAIDTMVNHSMIDYDEVLYYEDIESIPLDDIRLLDICPVDVESYGEIETLYKAPEKKDIVENIVELRLAVKDISLEVNNVHINKDMKITHIDWRT